MNILWEISEKSNDLISLLDINGFFDKPQFKHFCPKTRLKIELEIKMKEKWNAVKNYNLSSNEFENIVQSIIRDEISETLYDLLDANKINLSINKDGKLIYSLSDTNQYFEYTNGFLKIFRNKKNI